MDSGGCCELITELFDSDRANKTKVYKYAGNIDLKSKIKNVEKSITAKVLALNQEDSSSEMKIRRGGTQGKLQLALQLSDQQQRGTTSIGSLR